MYKLIFTTLLLSITSSFVIAQHKADIGFIFNTFKFNRINLEYRTPIRDNYKLKFGVTIGQSNDFSDKSPNNYYTFANDSVITLRKRNYTNFQGGFKIGIEHQLGSNSMFSFGADLNVAYRNEKVWLYDEHYLHIDSSNNWVHEAFIYPENFYSNSNYDNPLTTKINRTYIVPQLQFNFLIDIPVTKDLYLNLFVGGLIGIPFVLDEKNKFDPNNELPSLKDVYVFEMTSQAGLGFRYSIGKEKYFTPKTDE